jgi:GNAT superfamily N-acetyltransferase
MGQLDPYTAPLKSEPELVAASNLNFAGSYCKLAQHCPRGRIRTEGAVMAFVTGVPISIFNGCLVLERSMASDLAAAAAWVASEAVPYHVWIDEGINPPRDESGVPEGFVKDPWTLPGMVLLSNEAPPSPPAGVTVVPVEAAGLAEFVGVHVASGLPAALAKTLFSPALAADPDVQLFTARLDGRPVGTALAIRTGDVSGVYAVGTLKQARHRGVGTAATWAAVAAGRTWGCDTIVLQASEMGYSVYSTMGFRPVVRYAVYGQSSY